MNYELAHELKDAGFLQYTEEKSPLIYPSSYDRGTDGTIVFIPTLSELIAACGEATATGTLILKKYTDATGIDRWHATDGYYGMDESSLDAIGEGLTPEEAVARLWLALNLGKVITKPT